MQTSAIQTKDHLFDLINVEDKMTFIDNSKKVLDAMMMQQGLWVELGYAYKGQEIAHRIVQRCAEFLQHCQHAMTIKSLTKLKEKAAVTQTEFFKLQQEHMATLG